MLFQIISRNNDINGNPYRLMICYSINGKIIEAYEARSSIPNQAATLRRQYNELPTFHVSPSEYKQTKLAVASQVEIERVD